LFAALQKNYGFFVFCHFTPSFIAPWLIRQSPSGLFASWMICPLALDDLPFVPFASRLIHLLACSPLGLFALWLICPHTLDDSPLLNNIGPM